MSCISSLDGFVPPLKMPFFLLLLLLYFLLYLRPPCLPVAVCRPLSCLSARLSSASRASCHQVYKNMFLDAVGEDPDSPRRNAHQGIWHKYVLNEGTDREIEVTNPPFLQVTFVFSGRTRVQSASDQFRRLQAQRLLVSVRRSRLDRRFPPA